MCRLFILLIGVLYFRTVNSYVLPKNENSRSELMRKDSLTERNDRLPNNSGRRQYDNGYSEDTNSLESVVLAIDTGVKQLMAGKTKPDLIDSIAKAVVDFAKNTADPIYRSKVGQGYELKPEIIHFRSDKPSVMFEINSKSIINVLRDMLQSKTVHKYMDRLTKEAAIFYRAMKRELEKSQQMNQ